MKLKFYIAISFLFFIINGSNAQQFTMKGGVIYSKMHTREIVGRVEPLLNYYYEANYCYRFGRGKFWTVGFGYLGSGGTIYDSRIANVNIDYHVDIRFSNLIFPAKLKISTEHRAHPRYYAFVGVAPAWMFNEERELEYTWQDAELERRKSELHDMKKTLFPYTAKQLQGYVLIGGGVYYKHVVLDVSAMINTFNVYKEHVAPVSFNSGVIATIGVQISRARNKMW
ncbi:MAG: hypothetical protein II937_06085 [Bacteroidales bacterium]|nr:hypothetical protein [Bacteroidales bacterium]